MIEYLKGRSGRKEFWASIGLLLLVGIGLSLLHVNGASGVTMFLWFIVWGRRLHDLGKSAARVLAPIGAMIAVTIVAFLWGGQALIDAVQYSETGTGPISDRGGYLFFGLVVALLAIQAGFTIWLGARAGDGGDNRFGSPPKDLLAS